MKVISLPILNDNYAYILHGSNNEIAVVDPGEADPIIAYCEEHALTLTHILNTHHHGDHIAGNQALIERYNAILIGPASEAARITGMDTALHDGAKFTLFNERVEAIETPGHTSGHICFHLPQSKILFSGDTLFSMGCGRLFEGSAEDMFTSLEKLQRLPDDTLIYCGHEYTRSNAEFCLQQEPNNAALKARYKEVLRLRENAMPTIPVTLGIEKQTNVFLRSKNAADFAKLRRLKDNN